MRLLAGLGFLLGFAVLGVLGSAQFAVTRAESYLRDRYQARIELPVRQIRPTLLTRPPPTGQPMPLLGFCWTIELDAGASQAEVTIDPWSHEVLDWQAEL